MTSLFTKKSRWCAALLVIAGLLSCGGCASRAAEPVKRTALLLDTVVSLTVYGDRERAESAADECLAEIRRCEALFSRTIDESDIARLNRAGGEAVEVSGDTARLLALSLQYSALSGGAFDVTVAPASLLWDFKTESPSLPDPARLAEAVSRIGYEQLALDGRRAALSGGGAVDLGGIAKGYIADRLAELLAGLDVPGALIDLGGNVLAFGEKPDGSSWSIGITDPAADGVWAAGEDTPAGSLAAVIPVSPGQTVVTSGIHQRGFWLDDAYYHHVLDPRTGYPAGGDAASVTVLAKESAGADALATACLVLGTEEGLSLIESLDGFEALFIRRDGSHAATSGWPAG